MLTGEVSPILRIASVTGVTRVQCGKSRFLLLQRFRQGAFPASSKDGVAVSAARIDIAGRALDNRRFNDREEVTG
jgi:hypothetical protein